MHPLSQSLSLAHVAGLMDALQQVYLAVDSDQPEHDMMRAVAGVVPCFAAVANKTTLHPNRLTSWSSRRPEVIYQRLPVVIHHLHDHPAMLRLTQNPDHEPVRLSDLGTGSELGRNPLVAGYYIPGGLRHQAIFSAGRSSPRSDEVWVIGINRMDGTDFSDDDLQLVALLRPHLRTALDMLQRRRQREAAAAARDAAGSAAGCASFSVDASDAASGVPTASAELLARWFGATRHLPAPLDAMRQALVHPDSFGGNACQRQFNGSDGASLHVHASLAHDGSQVGFHLLEHRPLDEATLQRWHHLSQRQASVGIWLALGKTNPEIAVLLGLSPRTVEKHVEAILEKLGAENRAQASRIMLDTARSAR